MDVLVEHAPLAKLTSVLPKKAQRGLFSQDITWTCITANASYIAVGSDIGTVFLYHRSEGVLDRLTCKTKTEIVSCVQMQSSYDDVVAAGTASGLVCVFQLPSQLPGRNKQLQLYIVGRSHHSPVRSLAWSSNAIKLFSGDEDGVVICTEVDYANEQSKSFHICKEPHRIIQLDYAYNLLLVSTTFRTFIIQTETQADQVLQVGKKDRKSCGLYGACFLPDVPSAQDALIFAARPGLRLWKANIEGVVQATYMLKNSPPQGRSQGVNLLPDVLKSHDYDNQDIQLGCLYVYQDNYLFTHFDRGCYLVDPGLGTIVAHHRNIGEVIDVAVCEDEIFVLRHGHDRPIIRLAKDPDPHLGLPDSYLNRMPGDTPIDILSNTAVKMSGSIVGALKSVGQKLQAVQEGLDELSPKVPPWGGMGKQEGVETIEPNEQDSVSPETDSAKEADSELNSPTACKEETRVEEESKEIGGEPPIVRLQNLPLLDVESQKEAFVPPPRPEFQLDNVDQSEDIVFSSKPRKRKVKKKKKNLHVDQDAMSISSMESGREVSNNPSPHLSASQTRALQPLHLPSPEIEKFGLAPALEELRVGESESEVKPSVEKEEGSISESGTIVRTPSPVMPSLSPPRESIPPPPNSMLFVPPQGRNVSPEAEISSSSAARERTPPPQIPSLSPYKPTSPLSLPKPPFKRLNSDEILAVVMAQSPSEESSKGIGVCAPYEVDSEDEERDSLQCDPDADSPYFPNYTRTNRSRTTNTETEDFYKMYRSYTVSSTGSGLEKRISECLDCPPPTPPEAPQSREPVSEVVDFLKKADVWSTFPGPNNMQSICVTERQIWAVDVQGHLYNSWLAGEGLDWKVCDALASQVAVSPSGWIVWRLHKFSVYAATGVTTRAPYGTKWVEVARKVKHIAVDNAVAWYVKQNGELRIQKDLNRDRPAYRSDPVFCSEGLIHVACLSGVVWVMTESRNIMVRVGIKSGVEEGQEWSYLQGLEPGLIPSYFCLGDQETAWILDMVGRLWFTTEVTSTNPQGSGHWWQVSLSSYLMQDASALDFIKTALSNPRRNLAKLINGEQEGLLTAAANGLWMCPGNKSVLHVCRGSLIGHRWYPIVLQGMMSSTRWTHLSASGLECSHGLLWAQQPNGSLFCFPPDYNNSSRVIEVNGPEISVPFRCLAASVESTWGLSRTGQIFIRAGMACHCPQGTRWAKLDLTQLGDAKLISMSCGMQNVWVVDKTGCVFMRISLKPPSEMALNPAWLPVAGSTNSLTTKFTHVYAGPNDWMVWALDNKNNVYARKGITDSMPIGTHWVYVQGANAVSLTISDRHVYALTPTGEVLVRLGILAEDVLGDYWRMIPGAFIQLSVAADDRLWGLTKEGAMQQRHIHFLSRKAVLGDLGISYTQESLDHICQEWEVI